MAAKGPSLYSRFQKSYCELVALLSDLVKQNTEDSLAQALAPNAIDHRALISSDHDFTSRYKGLWGTIDADATEEDSKPAANRDSAMSSERDK